MIRVEELSFRYPREEEILHRISFRIEAGEKVALVGLNGSGKSTLLHHLNGLLLPSGGRIRVGGIPVMRDTLTQVRQTVGLVFQQAEEMLFCATLYDDVAYGLRLMQLPETEIETRVMRCLQDAGLWEERYRSGATLSVGQCRSAALATVLAMDPAILLLDEPTAGLDARARRGVMRHILDDRRTCLIASHDLDFLRTVTGRTLLLEEGRLVHDAPTRLLLHDESLLREYDLL